MEICACGTGISLNAVKRTFQFTDIGANMLGNEKSNIFADRDPLEADFLQQDGHAHFQPGRLNGHC